MPLISTTERGNRITNKMEELADQAVTAGVYSDVYTIDDMVGPFTDLIFALSASLEAGAGNLDVTIETSVDGVYWETWVTFTQLSATGAEHKNPTVGPGGFMRVKTVVSATAEYNVDVWSYGRLGLS